MKINPILTLAPLIWLGGCAIDPYDYKAPEPILWRAETPGERAAAAVLADIQTVPQTAVQPSDSAPF